MKKILVVEDEAAIREFVVINLQRAGYDVTEADCGEKALQIYEESPSIPGIIISKTATSKSGLSS